MNILDTKCTFKGCRIFRTFDFPTVFFLIEVFDTAVYPKIDGVRETFNMGCPVRTLVLLDSNVTGMG